MRDALTDEFAGFERKLRGMARQDDKARRLMTTPGASQHLTDRYSERQEEAQKLELRVNLKSI